MWEGYRRHTGPELHTGGMRGSKPAGFSNTGDGQRSLERMPTPRPTPRQHKHRTTPPEKHTHATPEELLEYLASQPLSRAFPALVRSLPEALPEPPGNHDVLLGCTAQLLQESQLQTVALSLLLEVAAAAVHKLGHAPTEPQRERAAALAAAHPRFYRKLTAAYGAGGDATAAAAAAVAATDCLWASGDVKEAAMVVLDFALVSHLVPAATPAATPAVAAARLPFDMAQLMEALLEADAMNELLRLVAGSAALQISLVEKLEARQIVVR
jgi:hypothetical protein